LSTIRKALLPTGIALAFLLFLGAVGSTPATFASGGDICAVDHYEFVPEADFAVWATLEGEDGHEFTVTVDDGTGSGSIVGVLDGDNTSDLQDVGPTSIVQDVGDFDEDDFSTGLNNLLDDYHYTGANACDAGDGDENEVVLVIVACDEIGTFTVSFSDESEDDDSMSIEVDCRGDVDTGTISARPTSVEIAPSYANVSHSLITVTLLDDNDEAAWPGNTVLFQTDRCSIEEGVVDTESEFEAAEGVFRALTALNPETAFDVEDFFDGTPMDSTPQLDETTSFPVTSSSGSQRTIAAAVLFCNPVSASGVTPGVANITAIVERGGDDLVLKTTVTVVGPPAANGVTVTASPASLICGEKATISVDIKDSIGQAVSDHTLVEAVTNAGGVLGGTGAVAGGVGLVSPISSTVAETYGGKATIYLLTSTQHVGKYEVVITTGGGGGVTYYGAGHLDNGGHLTNVLGGLFTTPPISVQVTVECSLPAPAPAPTVKAPATGQGITPPSTGDAGLATSESSSLTLVIGAVVAAMVFGGLVISRVRQN